MRKIFIPIALATLFLVLTFGVLRVVRGQTIDSQAAEVVVSSESQSGNTRQVTAPEGTDLSNQPLIGFIESPTAACVQPDTTRDECFINWYYMAVDAAPNYMISMTVMLNDFGFVGGYSGFFQTNMYVPYNMNPEGYKVACGALGSGGNPYWGEAYGYTIRARDSAGLRSGNYGTVVCPAYTP